MEVPAQRERRTGNHILDALSPESFDDLWEHLEPFELRLRDRLVERGDRVERAYFPTEGLISLVSVMQDGSSVETAAIGPEGVMGIPALLDANRTMSFDAITQLSGQSFAMDAGVFLERAHADGRLRDLVEAYTHALFVMIGQNAACNRLHSMSERTSRWMLMARDRAGGDQFRLTHEFLAQMLGVRRASVTEAAEDARASGAIRYVRGVLTIVDRPGLERTACECYAVSRDAFEGIYE